MGTWGNGVYSSINYGKSWTHIDSGLTNTNIVALAANETNVFAATLNGVFSFTNNGTTWDRIDSGFAFNDMDGLTVSGKNIYACQGPSVYLSTNNGASWINLDSGYVLGVVQSLIVQGENLYAVSWGEGIYRSTDNGINWVQVDSGLTTLYVSCLLASGADLFAATDGKGIFLSTNNGVNWTAVDSGFSTARRFYTLTMSGTNLFTGGYFNGIWMRPLSEMVTSVQTPFSSLPTRFSLFQNFPNPFNPSTTVTFAIPTKTYVTIMIFDVLGREVSTLVSEQLQPGNYTRQWNAINKPSGVYFYRLQTETTSETKKLLLLK